MRILSVKFCLDSLRHLTKNIISEINSKIKLNINVRVIMTKHIL